MTLVMSILYQSFGYLSVIKNLVNLVNSTVAKKLFITLLLGIKYAEAFYSSNNLSAEEENKVKLQACTDFFNAVYDEFDKEYNFNEEVDKFIKEIFVPKTISLLVPFLKSLGLIKKEVYGPFPEILKVG